MNGWDVSRIIGAAPDQGTLTLQRFTDHPDPDARWAEFSEISTPIVQVSGPESVEFGKEAVYDIYIIQSAESGAAQTNAQGFDLRSELPYPSEDIERVDYLLVSQDKVYQRGQADYVNEGYYQVTVDQNTVNAIPGGMIQLQVGVVTKRTVVPSSSGVGFDNHNFSIYLPLTQR